MFPGYRNQTFLYFLVLAHLLHIRLSIGHINKIRHFYKKHNDLNKNSGYLTISWTRVNGTWNWDHVLALTIKNEKRLPWAWVWAIDKNASEFFSIISRFKQGEFSEHLLWCDRETFKYRKLSVHFHCAEALAKSVSFPQWICYGTLLQMYFDYVICINSSKAE